MLNEDELHNALLLVFANKWQGLLMVMNTVEITDKFGLHGPRQRMWYIQVDILCSLFTCRLEHLLILVTLTIS